MLDLADMPDHESLSNISAAETAGSSMNAIRDVFASMIAQAADLSEASQLSLNGIGSPLSGSLTAFAEKWPLADEEVTMDVWGDMYDGPVYVPGDHHAGKSGIEVPKAFYDTEVVEGEVLSAYHEPYDLEAGSHWYRFLRELGDWTIAMVEEHGQNIITSVFFDPLDTTTIRLFIPSEEVTNYINWRTSEVKQENEEDKTDETEIEANSEEADTESKGKNEVIPKDVRINGRTIIGSHEAFQYVIHSLLGK
jgi:hypothetical protein